MPANPPVIFENLGLLVKLGEDPLVTTAEGQSLWVIRRLLPWALSLRSIAGSKMNFLTFYTRNLSLELL